MITANNPDLVSWIHISEDSDFPIQNIPFGVGFLVQDEPFVATRIGDKVINLAALNDKGYFNELGFQSSDFNAPSLNALMKYGKYPLRNLRNRISCLFTHGNMELQGREEDCMEVLYSADRVQLLLPVNIGDCTDFYSSKEHATNVGTMFRDPANALLPNWLWLPVGYHGRSSSIITSEVPVVRPKGQTKVEGADPNFEASARVDFELEMGFYTFDGKPLGERISTSEAEDFIFGLSLFNDWSARDIQQWEYVPLGPFLAKNFASSISI